MNRYGTAPSDSPNPHRLYRIPDQGIIGGVCAGVADYFGVATGLVRLALVLAVIFFTPLVLVGYLVARLLMPVRPTTVYRDEQDEAFWRGVTIKPDNTLASLNQRFRKMEKRVADMEAHVTTNEFELSRQIRNLER